eukprot:g4814.t1
MEAEVKKINEALTSSSTAEEVVAHANAYYMVLCRRVANRWRSRVLHANAAAKKLTRLKESLKNKLSEKSKREAVAKRFDRILEEAITKNADSETLRDLTSEKNKAKRQVSYIENDVIALQREIIPLKSSLSSVLDDTWQQSKRDLNMAYRVQRRSAPAVDAVVEIPLQVAEEHATNVLQSENVEHQKVAQVARAVAAVKRAKEHFHRGHGRVDAMNDAHTEMLRSQVEMENARAKHAESRKRFSTHMFGAWLDAERKLKAVRRVRIHCENVARALIRNATIQAEEYGELAVDARNSHLKSCGSTLSGTGDAEVSKVERAIARDLSEAEIAHYAVPMAVSIPNSFGISNVASSDSDGSRVKFEELISNHQNTGMDHFAELTAVDSDATFKNDELAKEAIRKGRWAKVAAATKIRLTRATEDLIKLAKNIEESAEEQKDEIEERTKEYLGEKWKDLLESKFSLEKSKLGTIDEKKMEKSVTEKMGNMMMILYGSQANPYVMKNKDSMSRLLNWMALGTEKEISQSPQNLTKTSLSIDTRQSRNATEKRNLSITSRYKGKTTTAAEIFEMISFRVQCLHENGITDDDDTGNENSTSSIESVETTNIDDKSKSQSNISQFVDYGGLRLLIGLCGRNCDGSDSRMEEKGFDNGSEEEEEVIYQAVGALGVVASERFQNAVTLLKGGALEALLSLLKSSRSTDMIENVSFALSLLSDACAVEQLQYFRPYFKCLAFLADGKIASYQGTQDQHDNDSSSLSYDTISEGKDEPLPGEFQEQTITDRIKGNVLSILANVARNPSNVHDLHRTCILRPIVRILHLSNDLGLLYSAALLLVRMSTDKRTFAMLRHIRAGPGLKRALQLLGTKAPEGFEGVAKYRFDLSTDEDYSDFVPWLAICIERSRSLREPPDDLYMRRKSVQERMEKIGMESLLTRNFLESFEENNRKFIENKKKPRCVVQDLLMYREGLKDAVKLSNSSVFEGHINSERVISKLYNHFSESNAPILLLSYNGPGEKESGNWLLGPSVENGKEENGEEKRMNAEQTRRENATLHLIPGDSNPEKSNWINQSPISFQTVATLWLNSKACKNGSLLCIILDSCYSGAWVEEAHAANISSIVIQAACSSSEKSYEGTFMQIFNNFHFADKPKQEFEQACVNVGLPDEPFYGMNSSTAWSEVLLRRGQSPCFYQPRHIRGNMKNEILLSHEESANRIALKLLGISLK